MMHSKRANMRIGLVNDLLLNLGAKAFLGHVDEDNRIQYDEDENVLEFIPSEYEQDTL
tara:strand:- start:509 stop:682 length:174 start_codon:yes stop_codon:yes gene_type:complete